MGFNIDELNIKVEFPDIKVRKNDTVLLQLESVELLPGAHRSLLYSIIYDACAPLRDFAAELEKVLEITEEDLTKNTPPRFYVATNNTILFDSGIIPKNATPLGMAILKPQILKKVEEELSKIDSVKMQIGDKHVSVPVIYPQYDTYSLCLSEELLRYTIQGDLDIAYMDKVHVSLWKAFNKLPLQRTMEVTLIKLDLINDKEVTDIGNKVLEYLANIIPIEFPKYDKCILSVLLDKQIDIPVVEYLKKEGYYDERSGVTDKGRLWLAGNSKKLFKKCNKRQKVKLIQYIDSKDLVPYLTSESLTIRRAATARFKR